MRSAVGDTDVTEIWISLDGGASWVQDDFLDPISRHAWRRWKYDRDHARTIGPRYTVGARDGSSPPWPSQTITILILQLCDRSRAANRGEIGSGVFRGQ
jgi:hypothetical protein